MQTYNFRSTKFYLTIFNISFIMNTYQNHFNLFDEKMHNAKLPQSVIDSFHYYYRQLLEGHTGYIYENEIKPVANNYLPQTESLNKFATLGCELLPQVIHIVLNGGLGTSMGLLGPKSLLRVKGGMSFMEIALCHAKQLGINMAFMNSFNTESQTINALLKLNSKLTPYHFIQNKFPKVNQADLTPICYPEKPDMEWNPPGHGDIYISLYTSGLLDELLKKNIKYAFISNVDNLRATIEPDILGYFASQKIPFLMEVANKTVSDVKGGHLAKSIKGDNLILRELAQCPAENHDDFINFNKYPLFNTNNIWIDLRFLHDYLSKYSFIPLPIIVNQKTVDYCNRDSHKVYQIESAMGAAINIFEGASALQVPRSRLLAVKTCNDLLAVRSDCYNMNANNEIYMVLERLKNFNGRQPKIDLDSRYFANIDDFENRFLEIPSLLNCESFTVKGDFLFQSNISIHGNVYLLNTTKKQITIQSNSVLKGEIVY